MKKFTHLSFLKLASAATFLALSTSLSAALLTEDFESEPFSAWESDWLGLNSNILNFYGLGDNRSGTTPSGSAFLFFTDGDTDDNIKTIDINFTSIFGSSIKSFSMDLDMASAPTLLEVFDGSGTKILDYAFDFTVGFETISIPSTDGISRFLLTGSSQIVGNASIDNVNVSTIPVPAAAWLFGSGLIGLIAVARRKTQA